MSLVIPIDSSEADAVTATRLPPRKVAERLAADFAQTAIERDRQGGTAKRERDLLRQSGLLSLLVPQELGGNGSVSSISSWRPSSCSAATSSEISISRKPLGTAGSGATR
jgi:alkylation response protein AidB-like acyl-CoA dehydrogenase